MDRPAVHRSSLPQSWSQPYPHSAPPNHNHSRPRTAPYPSHDQHNPYTAPALYPNVVSQQMPQMPHRYTQPVPNMLMPGGLGVRPRANSSIADHNPYGGPPPPVPQFHSPAPPHFPQAHPFSHTPALPSKPPAFQPNSSSYQLPPTNNQTQDVVPIRPSPMSARRSSSSPAINRIPQPDAPPPIPPLPPSYQSGDVNPQRAPQRTSPVHPPPPSIPIPSPGHSYRSDSSPLYDSPYDTVSPPLSAPPPPFPAGSPPKFEGDIKRAPVDEEAEALAMAIALSEKESKQQSGMVSQEEEDIAKAIEESMKHASSWGVPVSSSGAGPSKYHRTTAPPSFPSPSPVSEPPVSPQTSLTPSQIPHASRPTSKVSSPLMRPAKPTTDDDGALAERLAEEEERAAAAGPSNPRPPVLSSPKQETTTPPAPASSASSRKRQEAHQPKFTVVNSDSDAPPPMYHHVVSGKVSIPEKSSPTMPVSNTSLGRASSASAVTPSSSRHSPIPQPDKPPSGRSQSLNAVPTSPSSAGPIPPVPAIPNPLPGPEEPYDAPPVGSPTSSASTVPANSFIDQQLLYGVCKSLGSHGIVGVLFTTVFHFPFAALGFNPPQISSIKTTMKGGVPNVISLPTGRYVPFHIQAPDWRHLLKMMARLSGSRIEAAVEALASSKQELKLRTIVQFVKVRILSLLR